MFSQKPARLFQSVNGVRSRSKREDRHPAQARMGPESPAAGSLPLPPRRDAAWQRSARACKATTGNSLRSREVDRSVSEIDSEGSTNTRQSIHRPLARRNGRRQNILDFLNASSKSGLAPKLKTSGRRGGPIRRSPCGASRSAARKGLIQK